MELSLKEFLQQLEDIKKLIEYYELEKKLLQDFTSTNSSNDILLINLSTKLKELRISKLKFDYNSIVISLYGSFERFIESSIITYVERLNEVVEEYSKLPEVIRKQHFILSLTLINKVEQSKYSGPLRKELIIKNLHTCINTVEKYTLNKEAFSQHTANFRNQVIEENFNQIGIESLNNKIIKTLSFQNYLIVNKGIDAESPLLVGSENLQIVNDLAELRNFVAHGIGNDIIDNTILLDYILFFEKYAKSLVDVSMINLLYREVENKGIKLGDITDVYSDGNVVCFYTNAQKISKGQEIIGINKKEIVKSNIQNIQLDGTDLEFVEGENKEVGIMIDKKFKKNYTLYIIN